ncbi:unnamed protein product [Effrenium voratum]|nr:unnamed protein product [Effrenium voratum]
MLRPCLALDASDNSLGPVGLHTLVDGLRGPLLRVSLARTGLFGRVGGQAVARLLRASPGLGSLDVSGNNGFGAASLCATGIDLGALAAEIPISYSLRTLVLADCSLEGVAGGQQLAAVVAKLRNLDSLDMHSNNNLGPSGLLAFSHGVSSRCRVSCINLEDTGLEELDGGLAAATLLSKMPSLRTLKLSNNILSPLGLQALAESVPQNNTISCLELRSCGLLSAGNALHLLAARCRSLEVLDVGEEHFESLPPQALCCARMTTAQLLELKPRSLQTLDLSKSQLGSAELHMLAKLLEAQLELRSLKLDHCKLDGSLTQLFEAPGLWQLSLTCCSGFGSAMMDLTSALETSPLRRLDLTECGLEGTAGGHDLGRLLPKLPALQHLCLAKNYKLENTGLQAFGQELAGGRHQLSELNVSCCSLVGAEGAHVVMAILGSLPSLESLSVCSNPSLGLLGVAALLEQVPSTVSSLALASCGLSAPLPEQNLSRLGHLTGLDLSANTVGSEGLEQLALQLPQMSLQQLDLADCGLESGAGGAAVTALLARCHEVA